MARTKAYREDEVIQRAMDLFWRNGYQSTSMQMLEQEMGINKFSIYASFGSKHGVFLESLKCYKSQVNALLEKLKNAPEGVAAIKQFFYDSVAENADTAGQKGCFLTNTYNEFSESEDEVVKEQMATFMLHLKALIIEKLSMDTSKDDATLLKQANYLLLAKHGLAAASRVNSRTEIEDYIELTFKNL
ncbi:TetR/AcrR family transcriptional regulator [Flavobacterium sp. SM2513]|uniref:TetR/AcrR family transcriptional regulator n=1 Tax=Flavobacterium sp. SM2513 TaxID=3424766 RepID=UPI003D7F7ACF